MGYVGFVGVLLEMCRGYTGNSKRLYRECIEVIWGHIEFGNW